MRIHIRRHCTRTVALVVATLSAPVLWAQSAVHFDLPSQPLADALRALGTETNISVVFDAALVEGRRAPALNAQVSVNEALARLLAGSGLTYRFLNERTIVLTTATTSRAAEAPGHTDANRGRGAEQEAIPVTRLAQAEASRPANAAMTEGSVQANAGPRAASDFRLEEVIVSATKREQSVQDIPVSVTALTESDILRAGYDGYRDWAAQVPGLTALGTAKNRAYFVMRGVTTSITGQNAQDPVAVYIGDVPVTDTFAAFITPDLRLFDVDRVEVLRGPQGTVFGSGAMGGAIRVLVNQPDLQRSAFKARVDVSEQGGGFQRGYDVAGNIPLVDDKFAVRFVGYYRDEDGYVNNIGTGIEHADSETAKGGRLLAKWKIRDGMSLTTSIIHQTSDPKDESQHNPGLGALTRRTPIALPTAAEFTFYNLTLDAEFANASLYSSTTYAEKSSDSLGDLTQLGLLFAPLGVTTLRNAITDSSETLVQELRLASTTPDSTWDWLVGGYYRDVDRSSPFRAELLGLGALGIPGATDDCLLCIELVLPGKEYGLFGEVGHRFSEQWKVSLGARASWFDTTYQDTDGIDRVSSLFGYLAGVSNNAAPRPRSILNRIQDNVVTPKLSLSYTPAEQVLLYLSAAQGYRIGQNNPNFGPDPILGAAGVHIPANYESDSLWSYEFGWKMSLLDQRLIANGSVYYTDWKDMQISQGRPSDQLTFIANAGEAHTAGVELELLARPIEELALQLALTVQEAKVDVGAPLAGSRKGDKLPGVADKSLSASAQYTFPLWQSGWDGYVRGNTAYVGESVNAFPNSASTRAFRTMGQYAVSGLSAGIFDDRWDITVFVDNVADKDPDVLLQPSGLGNYRTSLRPRTFGLRVTVQL